MNASSFDIHQLITDQIIAAIEADVGEFKLAMSEAEALARRWRLRIPG